MSIWTDSKGRTHVGYEKDGIRGHRAKGVTAQNAEQIEREVIAEVEAKVAAKAAAAERARAGFAPEVTIEAGCQRYLSERPENTRPDATYRVELMREWTDGHNLTEVVDVFDKMVADMTQRGYKPASINRRGAILRRIARQAHENRKWWIVDASQVPVKLDKPLWVHMKDLPGGQNARDTMLTSVEQVAALIDACQHEIVKDWITIAIHSGMRVSEVLKINCGPDQAGLSAWERPYVIHYDRGVIEIPLGGQKNKHRDSIPIVPDLAGLPSMTAALRRCPLTIHKSTVQDHVKKAAASIGVDVTPHSIRRSTGYILLKAGVPIEIISKILRHSSLQITMKHYLPVTADLKREAIIKAFSKQQAS